MAYKPSNGGHRAAKIRKFQKRLRNLDKLAITKYQKRLLKSQRHFAALSIQRQAQIIYN